MYEQYLLTNREFCNVSENGRITGFQVKIRIPAYRALCVAQIDDISVEVDGEKFSRDKLTFTAGGRSYPLNALRTVMDLYWRFGELATVTVSKPGGLATGTHTVTVGILVYTGVGNAPPRPGAMTRQERLAKLASDPQFLEEQYRNANRVTKRMSLVQ